MAWLKDKKNETPADLSGLQQSPAADDVVSTAVAAAPAAPLTAEKLVPASAKKGMPAALLTPEAQAYTSQMIKDAITSVFEQLGPVLKDMALTPEKIAEMERIRRAPTESEAAALARNEREKKLMISEMEENAKNKERLQAGCLHRYPTGQLAIQLVRNFPDRQVRGLCNFCQVWLHPREWRIESPDANHPRGREVIVEAHPQYFLVKEVLQTRG